MNFTREPILETIISAKEGFKLKLKSTKNEGGTEFLVDAVEVVCLGTTYFYRSGEPAHTFFLPAQDFEISQVRETRLLLKTPTEKAIKIAGGADAGEKQSENPKDTNNQPHSKGNKEKFAERKTESNKQEPKAEANGQKKPNEHKEIKDKQERKGEEKRSSGANHTKKAPRVHGEGQHVPKEVVPSMFSHLLRPPEALISDSIHKYQNIIDDQKEQKIKKEAELKSMQAQPPIPAPNEKVTSSLDHENLTFEKAEEVVEVKRPLSLKEKMRKVLAPSIKDPAPTSQHENKE